MNTPTQIEQPQQPSISLGEKFRKARQALNLTIDDAVAKTNLNFSIIEKLENNAFDGDTNIPTIFVNGYIRSYAQFLKMPEEEWKGVNLGQKIENDLNKNARTGQVTNPYSSSSIGRWVGYLTVLVILVMGGMTALWWWENYQQSNTERDNLVQNYVSADDKSAQTSAQMSTTSTVPVANNEPVTLTPVAESKPNNNEPVVQTQPLTAANEPPAITNNATNNAATNEPATLNTPLAENTPPQATDAPLVVRTIPIENTAKEMLMQHSAEQQAQNQPTEPQTAENTAAAASGELQIEVTGANCWITVRDGSRKVLAQKEYKQGEILTFNEGAPYSLTIGAPGNVKITYNGELYPLKVDGRVARFKLE